MTDACYSHYSPKSDAGNSRKAIAIKRKKRIGKNSQSNDQRASIIRVSAGKF